MEELRSKSKTFDRFVSKVEFKIKCFLLLSIFPRRLEIQVRKKQIFSEEEKKILRLYIAYKYVIYSVKLCGDDVSMKEFSKSYQFKSYYICY